MFELPDISGAVAAALAEDLGVEPEVFSAGAPPSVDLLARDVTSFSVVGLDAAFSGRIVARESCVVCGLPVAAAVFETLSVSAGLFEPVEFFPLVAEGSRVGPGTAVAEVEGLAVAVLAAERSALDFLMVLSGIATTTARWVDEAGPDITVCDTRKTVPGLRALSKYAVRVGGGTNHRCGLHDMVLIKDNHLARIGSIAEAVKSAREQGPGLLIEVEADSTDQALEAVRAGADMVLLDNMDDDTLARTAEACRVLAAQLGRTCVTEASGGIGFSRLPALRRSGVDRLSSSALTFAPTVDFGFDER